MNPKRIKIGPFKPVFRGTTIEVHQAQARLPIGKRAVFERVRRPASVAIFAFDEKNRLLLVREYRYRQKKYVWGVPSGRIDPGETPKAAAQRELREEAGIKAGKFRLLDISDESQTIEWKKYAYIATGLSPAPLPADDGEDISVHPTPLKKAAKEALDVKTLSSSIAFLIQKLDSLKKFA